MHVQPAPLRSPITNQGQRVVGSERPDHRRDAHIANAVATEIKLCHHHHRQVKREGSTCMCAEQWPYPPLDPHPLGTACGHADQFQRAIRRQCPSQCGRALVPNRIARQPKLPQRAVGHERIRQRQRIRGANPIVNEIELLAATRGMGAQRDREMSTMNVRATWAAPTQAPDAAHRPLSRCGWTRAPSQWPQRPHRRCHCR